MWTSTESGEQVRGRDAVRDLIVGMQSWAFDARPELRALVVGDGTAVAEAVFVGTHTGEFAGTPATGVQVRLPHCTPYDDSGGVVTALRACLPLAAPGALLAGAGRSAAAPA